MSDQIVQLVSDASNTGKKVDVSELTVGSNTVERQRVNIGDPTSATALAGVAQMHTTDNNSLGTFYGMAVGAVPQLVNVQGNLDRARGFQGDLISGTGLAASVRMTESRLPPTFATSSPTSGANKTISIPSTTGIVVGSVVQLELHSSSVVEWAVVTAVTSNTSITVANLANGHTSPFPVFPIQFNTERDVQGNQDLHGGYGVASSAPSSFDGSTYQRGRNAFGLGVYSDTSVSSVSAGNNVTITVAGTPPTLATGQTLPCLIYDQDHSHQELALIISTNPGSQTITFQTLAASYNGSGAHALQVRAPSQSVRGADPVNFNGWGLSAGLSVVYSGQDTNGVCQYSGAKDVNGAGLTPTQASSSGSGLAAQGAYGVYLTAIPSLTNKQFSPLQVDVVGNLLMGVGATIRNNASKPTAGSPIQNLNATKVPVKASAGTLYGFIIENAQNAVSFIQLFDAATGSVTLGTTKPDLEYAVAANGGSGATMVALPLPTCGWPFGTALTIAATTASGGSSGSSNGVSVYPVYA